MKIYKVYRLSHQESSQGFSYHSSIASAKKALKEFKRISKEDYNPDSKIRMFETQISAKAIINLLNVHASHNDNG